MRGARKSSVEVRFEILEFLYFHGPLLKTHLWRKATTLSYDDFTRHLNFLLDRGLVELDDNHVRITGEGRRVYELLSKALKSLL